MAALDTKTDNKSLVLVGCGWFACRTHCESLRKLKVDVVGVCARTQASRGRALKKLKHATIAEFDSVEACARSGARVALVALPAAAHADAVEALLAAGLHVITEKPGAWSPAAAAALRDAYDARPQKTQQLRALENWASKPGVLRVAALLDRRPSARSYAWRVRRRRAAAGDWRRSDATAELLDVLVHVVRACRVWFGDCGDVAGEVRSDADALRATMTLPHARAAGTVELVLFDGPGDETATCEIRDGGAALTWDLDARVVVAFDGAAETIPGDGWVAGGCKAALAEALAACGGAATAETTCFWEALRDCDACWRALGTVGFHAPPRGFCDALPRGRGHSRDPRPRDGGDCLGSRLVDVTDGVALVEAGMVLADLNAALRAHGRTLASWPVFQKSTVGGAVATASHGSSATRGTLSDAVVGARVVENGRSFWLDDGDELLRCYRASAGRLGVVVELALRTVATFAVVRSTRVLREPLEARPDWLAATFAAADHAMVWWRVDLGIAVALALDAAAGGDAAPYDGRNFAPYPPALTDLLGPVFPEAEGYTSQYAVADDVPGALRDVRAAVGGDTGAVVELKCLGASDRSYLGPNAGPGGGVVTCFNVWVRAPPPAWVARVEAALAARGAAPHWGKAVDLPPGFARPGLAAFDAVAAARGGAPLLDPRARTRWR